MHTHASWTCVWCVGNFCVQTHPDARRWLVLSKERGSHQLWQLEGARLARFSGEGCSKSVAEELAEDELPEAGLERDKDDIYYLPVGEKVVGAISGFCWSQEDIHMNLWNKLHYGLLWRNWERQTTPYNLSTRGIKATICIENSLEFDGDDELRQATAWHQ